jgi:hypothetical protein
MPTVCDVHRPSVHALCTNVPTTESFMMVPLLWLCFGASATCRLKSHCLHWYGVPAEILVSYVKGSRIEDGWRGSYSMHMHGEADTPTAWVDRMLGCP